MQRCKRLFFSRRRLDSDLEEELKFHLDMRRQKLISQGLQANEAESTAKKQFGNPARYREACLDLWTFASLENLWRDLRFSARTLRKNPGYTAVAVCTLALGIGANAAIFSVSRSVLVDALPFQDPSRLVAIGETTSFRDISNVGFETYLDWRERVRSFTATGAFRFADVTLSGQTAPAQLRALKATSDLLPLLGVKPVRGRLFTAAEDQPGHGSVALLSYNLWQSQFHADESILERPITLDERTFQVIGVLPKGFRPLLSDRESEVVDLAVPLAYAAGGPSSCRDCRHLLAIARLSEGVSVATARADLDQTYRVMSTEHAQYRSGSKPVLTPLRQVVFGTLEWPVKLLTLGAALVLLIACANLTNLLLLGASRRTQEMAIRTSLGASHAQIIRRRVIEVALLSLLGGAAGSLLAWSTTPLILLLAPQRLTRLLDVRMSLDVVFAALVLSLAAGLVCGLAAGIPRRRPESLRALREGSKASSTQRSASFRGALVVVQLSVSFVLIFASGLLFESLANLLSVSPGFAAAGVWTASVNSMSPRYPNPSDDIHFFERVTESVSAQAGIEKVAAVSVLPMSGDYDKATFGTSPPQLDAGRDTNMADRYVVTPGYFDLMRIGIRAGRAFERFDVSGSAPVVILNETGAQRLFPKGGAVGQRLRVPDSEKSPWATIVGVAADVHQHGYGSAPGVQVYVPMQQSSRAFMTLVVRTALRGDAARRTVQTAVNAVDATRSLAKVETMDEWLSQMVAPQRFALSLVGVYGILALSLAVVGMYGLMSVAVASRTREIGIRLAVGATSRQVAQLVLSQAIYLIVGGLLFGSGAAAATGLLLRGLLFNVQPTDLSVSSVSIAIIAAAALAACLPPVARAVRLDPVRSLADN